MKIAISELKLPSTGTVVLIVCNGGKLGPSGKALDKKTNGALERALKISDHKGAKGKTTEVMAPSGSTINRILLVGVGDGNETDATSYQNLAGSAVQRLRASGEKSLNLIADPVSGSKLSATEIAAHMAYGARLGGYRFEQYHQAKKKNGKTTLKSVTVAVKGAAKARKSFSPLAAVADGVVLTRDLVSEPPNVLYPVTFAKRCRDLSKLGVKVEVLNEARMAKLGMGALLGVGQGSARDSRIVVMRWDGGRRSDKPVAFVGKGVTFDTGGISLKPGPGMEAMKWDMGGAGTVTGLMKALAGRKAKVNAIGVIGLVENMPDGNAQRPGDIVTSMSGQTIEIHNTDAEGRLVLADALWYTQQRFKPRFMVDLATLTGAMLVALGHEYAGLFSNNDELSEQLRVAGEAETEPVWRMPMNDAFDKMINCPVADMKNVGGRFGGSITAAQFLQRFVNDVPWVHLDIAGMAWNESGKPTVPKGGAGFGVRLLNRLVADHYEN